MPAFWPPPRRCDSKVRQHALRRERGDAWCHHPYGPDTAPLRQLITRLCRLHGRSQLTVGVLGLRRPG